MSQVVTIGGESKFRKIDAAIYLVEIGPHKREVCRQDTCIAQQFVKTFRFLKGTVIRRFTHSFIQLPEIARIRECVIGVIEVLTAYKQGVGFAIDTPALIFGRSRLRNQCLADNSPRDIPVMKLAKTTLKIFLKISGKPSVDLCRNKLRLVRHNEVPA